MDRRSIDSHEILTGVLVLLVAGAVMAFANLPTRVSVLESQFTGIDKKLDQILDRTK